MRTRENRYGLGRFFEDEAAVTAIEYALLAALIFTVIVGSVGLVGNAVDALFATVAGFF